MVSIALIAAPTQAANLLTISITGKVIGGYDQSPSGGGGGFFFDEGDDPTGADYRFDVTFDTDKGVISNDYRSFRAGAVVGQPHGVTATMTINGKTANMYGQYDVGYEIQDDGLFIHFGDIVSAPGLNTFFSMYYPFDPALLPKTIEDDAELLTYLEPTYYNYSYFDRTTHVGEVFRRPTSLRLGEATRVNVKGIPRRAPDPEEPPTTAVPEPATWALMIMGFGLAGAGLRRRHAITA